LCACSKRRCTREPLGNRVATAFLIATAHWNALVANLELNGKGTFFDPRLNDPVQFPIAAAAGFGNVRNSPDLVTSKLAALHFYQLAIPAPKPPKGSFDQAAAARGEVLFNRKADCVRCHVPPLFTEPGWNMHTPEEIGIDDFQANRAPDSVTEHRRSRDSERIRREGSSMTGVLRL
jgi:hypothetical protein